LENVTHQFAVDAFVNAGEVVEIIVIPGEEAKVTEIIFK